MNKHGYTLVEVMVSVAILAFIGALSIVAVQTSVRSMDVSDTKDEVQSNVRELLAAMSGELCLAAKNADDSLNPPVEAATVIEAPAANSPVELVFQRPLDDYAVNWSNPIRFRFVSEDSNGDGLLQPAEDDNGNSTLDRQLRRIEDSNGDGDTADLGEDRPLGAANNVSAVQFAVVGGVVNMTVTASKPVAHSGSTSLTSAVSTSVYLQN